MFISLGIKFTNSERDNIDEALSIPSWGVKTEIKCVNFDDILLLKGVDLIKGVSISLFFIPKREGFLHMLIQITKFSAMSFPDDFFEKAVGNDMISPILTAKKGEYLVWEPNQCDKQFNGNNHVQHLTVLSGFEQK